MTTHDLANEQTPTPKPGNAAHLLAHCFNDLLTVEDRGEDLQARTRSLAFVLCQHAPGAVAEIAELGLRWSYAAKTALRLASLVYDDGVCLEALSGLSYRELIESHSLARVWVADGRQPVGLEEKVAAVGDLLGFFAHAAQSGLEARGANPNAHLLGLWSYEPEWRAADKAALLFARQQDPLSLRWSRSE